MSRNPNDDQSDLLMTTMPPGCASSKEFIGAVYLLRVRIPACHDMFDTSCRGQVRETLPVITNARAAFEQSGSCDHVDLAFGKLARDKNDWQPYIAAHLADQVGDQRARILVACGRTENED